MGLFDFMKEAGAKIFAGDEPKQQPQAPAARPAPSAEEARRALDAKRALALIKHVRGLGLDAEDLQIAVQGERITVRGKVPSQEVREKIVLAVGNTAGVAQVDDQLVVEAPAPEATFYTVQRGDTLSAIAKAHYGAAGKYMVIFEANRPLLSDPDKIYPGQVLRIPPLAG